MSEVINTDKRTQTMYPVTGASGGATRSPLLRMPTMLVSREPCHSNILQMSQCCNSTTTSWHKPQNL